MSGFFEALEIDDSLRKEANTKAIKLANMRVRNAYYDFLAQAPSRQERKARFALIKDDLNEVVANACHEAGHEDVDSIRKSVIYSLMSGLDKAAEVDLDRLSMGNSEEQPGIPGGPPAQSEGLQGPEELFQSLLQSGYSENEAAQIVNEQYAEEDPSISLDNPGRNPDLPGNEPEDPFRQGSRRPLGKQAVRTARPRSRPVLRQMIKNEDGTESFGPEVPIDEMYNNLPEEDKIPISRTPVDDEESGEEDQLGPDNPKLNPHLYAQDPRDLPPGRQGRYARRPQMCPFHKEVTDISLTSGDPRAGFQDMKDHWGGPQHCQGGDYAGPKCNFTREMTTQQFWDDREQKLQEQRQEREQERELQDSVTDRFEQPSESPENTGIIDDSAPAIDDSDMDMGGDHSDISESLSEAPSAVGAGEAVVSAYSDDRGQQKPGERAVFKPGEDDAGAAYREEEDQNRSITCPNCGSMVPAGKESCTQCSYQRGEKVDKDSRSRSARRRIRSSIHQALKDGDSVVEDQDVDRSVGPVPEMDKTKWRPTALSEDGGNLHPINTDSGTAHPSEFQDKFTKPDWGADRYDKTRAVTTTEPATTDTSISPEQMTSWENNGTNAVSDTRDNPLVISSTLPSDQHIQAAIREFESRK